MSFGFGIGDIIECCKIAGKTYSALKSAPKEFDSTRLEVASLSATLKALQDEEKCPTSLIHNAEPQRREDMRVLLENCMNGMEDIQSLVYKYSGMNSEEKSKFVYRIRFAIKDKQGPRDKLAIHTASINMFLTTLSHGSLGRLEFLIRNGPSYQPAMGDGTKGMPGGFGAAQTKTGSNRAWRALGEAMSLEGVTDDQMWKHKEEIQAYVRYLVRGETPFWSGSVSAPKNILSSGSSNHLRAETRLEAEERRYVTDDASMLRAKIVREKEEAKRKEAQEVLAREKVTTSDEKVDRLFEEFESLFDLGNIITVPPSDDLDDLHSIPGDGYDSDNEPPLEVKPPVEAVGKTKQAKTTDITPLASEIRDDRLRLSKLIERKKMFELAGDRAAAFDLEHYAIPDTKDRLRKLGCRHTCDVCQLPIGGLRIHCVICKKGNWDMCYDCGTAGKWCASSTHKMKTFTLEEDLRRRSS